MICVPCLEGRCQDCVDVIHVVLDMPLICKCTRANHSGDPTNRQIVDPEDGTVYGPCARIEVDGKVIIEHQKPIEITEMGDIRDRYHCLVCGAVYLEERTS